MHLDPSYRRYQKSLGLHFAEKLSLANKHSLATSLLAGSCKFQNINFRSSHAAKSNELRLLSSCAKEGLRRDELTTGCFLPSFTFSIFLSHFWGIYRGVQTISHFRPIYPCLRMSPSAVEHHLLWAAAQLLFQDHLNNHVLTDLGQIHQTI